MSKRRLTLSEKALITRIATRSSQGVLTGSQPSVSVGDELDDLGHVHWTTSVSLSDVLPDA